MFSQRLNRKKDGFYSVIDEIELKNGKFKGSLEHHNVKEDSVVVLDENGLVIPQVEISENPDRDWVIDIDINSNSTSKKAFIHYQSSGDIVDAEDINKIQDYLMNMSEQEDVPKEEMEAMLKQIEELKNTKAEMEHTHSANDIHETFSRNFIGMADKLKIQNIDDKADKKDIPKKVSELENDAGYITIDDVPEGGGGEVSSGVSSVNGKSGKVTLTGEDIKATSGLLKPTIAEEITRIDSDIEKKADKNKVVTSINGEVGDVDLSADNIPYDKWGSIKEELDYKADSWDLLDYAKKNEVVTSINEKTGEISLTAENIHMNEWTTQTVSNKFGQLDLDIWSLEDDKADVTYVDEKYDDLKKSVSDGKTKVANSITQKGVATKPTDTFNTMAENILNISAGGGVSDIHPKNLVVVPKEIDTQGVPLSVSGLGAGAITKIIDNGDFVGIKYGSNDTIYFLDANKSKELGVWISPSSGNSICFDAKNNTYKVDNDIYNRYGKQVGKLLLTSGKVLLANSEQPYVVIKQVTSPQIENIESGGIINLGDYGDEFLAGSDELIVGVDYNSNWTMDMAIFNWYGTRLALFDTKEDIEGMDVMGEHVYYVNYGSTNYLHKVDSTGNLVWKVALPRKLTSVYANGGLIAVASGKSLIVYDMEGDVVQDIPLLFDIDGAISSVFFGRQGMTLGTRRAEILRYDYKGVEFMYSKERV